MKDLMLEVALQATNKAVDVIIDALENPRMADYKGRTNLVTETDRLSEELILNHIRSTFPTHSILAEESGSDKNKSEYLWIIDPLDGTTNFVHGYPSFGVSIACLINGKPTIGVISELPAKHLYFAIKGKGAFKNNMPIHVSGTKNLDQSLLVTGFGYNHGELWEANMSLFKQFTDLTQGVRRLGAAAVDFCHVACGMVDGFWEFDLKPWDTAAGVLLVEEAGGTISRMDGDNYSIYDKQVMASNGQIHKEMLHYTKKTVESLNG